MEISGILIVHPYEYEGQRYIRFRGKKLKVVKIVSDQRRRTGIDLYGKDRKMSESISADKLAREIMRQMEEYTEEVKETTQDVAMNVSEKAVKKLKANSQKSSGRYAKGWTRESGRDGITVYNKKPTYRLTHLLEKGHQLKRGGRKFGEVRAYPHIEEVEQECIKEYVEELERRL